MTKKFNPIQYWQKQHQKDDLTSVGYGGIGLAFNQWMYKIRERVFKRHMQDEKINLEDRKILDIGSGNGFYPACWKSLGAQDITASDFSLKSLNNIPKNISDVRILKLDITKPIENDLINRYDIISAIDILFHIINDDAYKQAVRNIAQLLKSGGIFILSENLTQDEYRLKHQVCRKEKVIFDILRKNGFQIKKIQPVFFLMNSPIRSHNPILHGYWFLLVAILTRANFLGLFFGLLLYPLELRLTRTFPRGPSTEIIICQKT